MIHVSFILYLGYVRGEVSRTTTPPMSKSIAFGGVGELGIIVV